jgi:hypothetical protein
LGLFADGDQSSPDLCSNMFTTLPCDDLFAEKTVIRLFMYTAFQMVVSVKPMAMQCLLRAGYEKVIFFDASILILGSIGPITSRLPHTDNPGGGPRRANPTTTTDQTVDSGFWTALTGRPETVEIVAGGR